MILVLLAAFVLQGGTAETSGPDQEFLAQGRRVGERFRDAVNNYDPAAFRETFSPALQEAWDQDAVAADLDGFRHSRGGVTLVKLARRLKNTAGLDLVEIQLAAERCGLVFLRFELGQDGRIDGFNFLDEPPPLSGATSGAPVALPVRGEWFVNAGGSDPEGNHHMAESESDFYAVDLTAFEYSKAPSGHRGDGTKREDYFAFGREVVAAVPGRVVVAIDGVPDNTPQFSSQLYTAGNEVVIRGRDSLYTSYIHLKQGSVRVKVGDEVAEGQPIAECGCSGGAGLPHLHFGVADHGSPAFAIGLPVFFRDVVVQRDGREFEAERYEPRWGDRIRRRGEPRTNTGDPVQPPEETTASPTIAPKVVFEVPSLPFDLVDKGRLTGRRFAEAVNQGDGRSFRGLFNDAAKQELPLADLDDFLAALHEDHGKIVRSYFPDFTVFWAQVRYVAERGSFMATFTLEPDGAVRYFETLDLPAPPAPAGNAVPLALPVKGRWAVRWGGADPKGNPHMTQSEISRFAVDLVVPEDEEVHFYEGLRNEDFKAFGREVLAAADGEVVMAVDGNPDNPPGHADRSSTVGNAILVRHAEDEYALYGHLQRDSVAVKVGDRIQVGQTIARCGNSGETMRPHLQFGMINDADASLATGFPFAFRDVVVTRGDRDEAPDVYEPRAGDRVRRR